MIKAITEQSYQKRLDLVVDYIYQHLDEDIPIERLAEVACLSPYHWHRVYTAMRGETVAQTVRRLRLQRAADQLANAGTPIAQIASRAGFSAVESFGRAFKAAYEQSPAAYRAGGSHARFKAAHAAQDEHGFPIAIESCAELVCAAVPHQGDYMKIDAAMGQLFSQMGQQSLFGPETAMMAVFFDDPSLVAIDSLRAVACSPVAQGQQPAEPLLTHTIAAGQYAVLTYQGPYADMKDAYRWLYGVWLPASGFEAAQAPTIETYLNDPREVAPLELLTEIRLPLEPQS